MLIISSLDFQLIKTDPHFLGSHSLFTRWGRVGEIGKMNLKHVGLPSVGEREFARTFRSKTGNSWDDRATFVPTRGKYELIDKKAAAVKVIQSGGGAVSTLPLKTQSLLAMILSKDTFKSAMIDLKMDMSAVAKLPLGALDPGQVAKGLAILDQIRSILAPQSYATQAPAAAADITTLSGQFYQVIPHASPRHIKLPLVGDIDILQQKYDMLAVLDDISIGATISISSDSSIDKNYAELQSDLEILSPSSPEYEVINR